jgi:hypothetical protein
MATLEHNFEQRRFILEYTIDNFLDPGVNKPRSQLFGLIERLACCISHMSFNKVNGPEYTIVIQAKDSRIWTHAINLDNGLGHKIDVPEWWEDDVINSIINLVRVFSVLAARFMIDKLEVTYFE